MREYVTYTGFHHIVIVNSRTLTFNKSYSFIHCNICNIHGLLHEYLEKRVSTSNAHCQMDNFELNTLMMLFTNTPRP